MPARARAAPRRLRRSFGPLYTRTRGRRQARRTRVTWRRKGFKQHTAGTRPLPVLRGVASSPHTLTEAPPYARLRTSQIDGATPSDVPAPPPAGSERRSRERLVLDLAGLSLGALALLDACFERVRRVESLTPS